jgi:3'-phosphoadenosine 5'-phosphosulfate sulfotransferase (PAPS reductase)/FAD synthetase
MTNVHRKLTAEKLAEQAAAFNRAVALLKASDRSILDLDLRRFQIIVINTSAGKDSQTMLHRIVALARAQGVLDRVVAVHCDLGRSEWAGVQELAQAQCDAYGVPLIITRREKGDLLAHVEKRGMWPSSATRFCTSDHKRDQVSPVITKLVAAYNMKTWGRAKAPKDAEPVAVLNCIGLRGQESDTRAVEQILQRDNRASSTVREITRWLPIHDWSEAQVWETIRENNLPYHRAYDLGMGRLSCVFCIFAPPAALLIAGHHNRALLDTHVALETKIGHTFKKNLSLLQIQSKLDAGYVPAGGIAAAEWADCGGGY